MALSTNYIDDQIDTSANLTRKYRETVNEDGTKSFEDVTVYSRTGSAYGAAQVNAQNTEINRISESLTASDSLTFRFATDGAGNYGYLKADDSFVPFSSHNIIRKIKTSDGYFPNIVFDKDYDSVYILISYCVNSSSYPSTTIPSIFIDTNVAELIFNNVDYQGAWAGWWHFDNLYKLNNVKNGDKINITPTPAGSSSNARFYGICIFS